MSSSPTPQPGILEIALYQGGDSRLAGHEDVLKLSSNENPYGPSPKAMAAFAAEAGQLHRYPGTDHRDLRAAIAETWGLDADRVICGVGSDEILHLIAQGYAGPGDEVIHTEHGFGMYRIVALAAGAVPVEVPETERQVDVEAILAAVTPATRVVYVTNPGNPTGCLMAEADIMRLADGLPGSVVLVLDAAYAEFANGFDGGAGIVEARENVVMTRTFSKIYGLGGLRVGWAYAPRAIIDVLNRLRGPFNLSTPALAAAEAAARDVEFAEMCRSENARLRGWLAAELAKVGVPSDDSHTNFLLARFESEDIALACDRHLRDGGIIVRKMAGYGLPHCLRITVGDDAGCRRVANAVAAFMEARA